MYLLGIKWVHGFFLVMTYHTYLEVQEMLLKDAQIGQTYVVENISLPFQLERRLEALGMTRDSRFPSRKTTGTRI